MISKALNNLLPNAKWSIDNESIDSLVWHPDNTDPQPTEAEIQAEITRLQADYASKQYQRDRAAAYPSYADQFDLLYHGGYDAWKAAIDAIKQEYPKP